MGKPVLNYPQTGDAAGAPALFREPTPRAESHSNPNVVFIDIYGALRYLTRPGNLQLRGRRGVGKTIYLLSAHQKLTNHFRRNGKIISAYVDLSDLASLTEAAQCPPTFYVNQVYQRILSSVVDNVFYPENDTRRARDLTSLAEKQSFFQGYRIRNRLDKLKAYLKGPGEPIDTQKGFEEKNTEAFEYRPATVKGLLDDILRAFRADHLIVFLDEFSTNHLPQHLQPSLIRKLLETFDGSRSSIKFATIPGATTLRMVNSALGRGSVQTVDRIRTFDFEDESAKRPQEVRTGNMYVFLKNLAFANPGRFGKYILGARKSKAQIAAFNSFVEDTFQNDRAFEEFLASGEGLPRQLFDIFDQAYLSVSNMSRKLNRSDIWKAAFDNCKQKIDFELSTDKQCMHVLAKVYSTGSRIFKIEKVTEYIDTIERIAALGFIHACPVSPTQEEAISTAPLEYYYTSYSTEVYFQITRILTNAAGAPQNVRVEDMTYIRKSKYNQLYFKAKAVLLRSKEDQKNKSRQTAKRGGH